MQYETKMAAYLETFLYFLQIGVIGLEHLQDTRRSGRLEGIGPVLCSPHDVLPGLVYLAEHLVLIGQLSATQTCHTWLRNTGPIYCVVVYSWHCNSHIMITCDQAITRCNNYFYTRNCLFMYFHAWWQNR